MNEHTSKSSAEPLALLIAALPPRALLAEMKSLQELVRVVFQGFVVKEQTLTRLVVRQRLERELARNPEWAKAIFTLWQRLFNDLCTALDDPQFAPSPRTLAPLREKYGDAAFEYALRHAQRDEVRAWVNQLAEIPSPSHVSSPRVAPAKPTPAPPPPPDETLPLRREVETLQQTLQRTEREVAKLRAEYDQLARQLKQAQEAEAAQRKQVAATEERLEREQRREKKAEERVEELVKQVKQLQQAARKLPPPDMPAKPSPAPPSPPVPAEIEQVLTEAITVLKRGLTQLRSTPTAAPPPVGKQAAPPPVTPQPPLLPRAVNPAVTLPVGRRQVVYTVTQVLTALLRNDIAVIEAVRNGLAHLHSTPEKERQALATLKAADIPAAILTGPIRPALVDGSNVANMGSERRGRLAFLQQVRHSAWSEGYFPVFIIVDASLRHQIDKPDELMAMEENGELRMAPPGTSADELLIEEATFLHAVLLTNDRMQNWPAAKTLEKRHVELHRGMARLGGFHRSGILPFSW